MRNLTFNKIITKITWIIFVTSIFRILFTYQSLPNELGVHFAPNGTFDVIANKKDFLLVGYPYIMSFIILVISEVIIFSLNKIKPGFKITKTGETKVKELIKFLVNITKLFYIIYLSLIWSECMIRQVNMNSTFMGIFTITYLIITIINLILIIKNLLKYKK